MDLTRSFMAAKGLRREIGDVEGCLELAEGPRLERRSIRSMEETRGATEDVVEGIVDEMNGDWN